MGKKITNQNVLDGLRKRIEASSLRTVAGELEVSPAYLSDVMLGRRTVGRKISKALGLKRNVVIEKTVTFEKAG